MRNLRYCCICVTICAAMPVTMSFAGYVISQARGDAASIQATVDAFRQSLGTNNGVGGVFTSGRREINWDGVPDTLSAPDLLPGDFFNTNSARGVVLTTPGSGLQVSARSGNPTLTPVRAGNLNSSYPTTFTTFSAERFFYPLRSTITDVYFFVPGTSTPATVSGFGAVFSDVDSPNSASLEFFDSAGISLGKVSAPELPGSQTLSFVSARFTAGERVARVRINSGTYQLGINDTPPNGDVVVIDDFIYPEPTADSTRPTVFQYFPQVADGGGYRTAIVLTNPNPFLATGRIEWFADSGSPLVLTVNGRTGSRSDFAIPPGGVLRLQSDGSGSLETGYARVASDRALSGVALFQIADSRNALVTEAGVLQAVPQQRMSVFAVVNPTINTGIALVNTSGEAALTVLTLLDASGLPVADQVMSIAPGEHLAKFIDQIFNIPGGTFEGALSIYSSDALAATAVRMQLQPNVTISALPVSTVTTEGGRRDFDITPFVGTYRGTWTNPAAGTSGPARIDISANLLTRAAVVTIDFDGNYLGLGDPPAQSLPGTFDANGARVRGQGGLFGNLDVFISPEGFIIGFLTQLAGGTIPVMTYAGLLTPTRLDADYKVFLPNGQTVISILHMQKTID
jgi:hypothetical protein